MYYILLHTLQQGLRFPLISYHPKEIETRVIMYKRRLIYLLNLYKSFVKTSRTEHVQVCYHTDFNRFTLRVPALLSAIA